MGSLGGFRFLAAGRRRPFLALVLLSGFIFLLLRAVPVTFHSQRYGQYSSVHIDHAQKSPNAGKLRFFKIVDNLEIFLYSAIANYQEPSYGDLNIVISGFDSTSTDNLQCCVQMKGDKLYVTQATIFFRFYNEPSFIGPYIQMFYVAAVTKAKQYACVVPELGYEATHVTLTSSLCPVVHDEYLPIIFPKKVPGGLAICGKAAFGDQLDPNKLMEWFEMQRLLGVDHIQIMDADNPEPIQKVFRYYKEMGLLNPLPYELPGAPYGRGLDMKRWVKDQGDHDKSFPILDCTQRLKGYSYVLGIDMDEVLIPAHHSSIKDFAKHMFTESPDAAGFYFYTQFFIYDWGPSNNQSDVTLLRYVKSTLPRNECKKYIYLTNRIRQARTHEFDPKPGYSIYWTDKDEAILHHYRRCPKNVWSTCNPPKMTDTSVLRYQSQLQDRVRMARAAIGISPTTS